MQHWPGFIQWFQFYTSTQTYSTGLAAYSVFSSTLAVAHRHTYSNGLALELHSVFSSTPADRHKWHKLGPTVILYILFCKTNTQTHASILSSTTTHTHTYRAQTWFYTVANSVTIRQTVTHTKVRHSLFGLIQNETEGERVKKWGWACCTYACTCGAVRACMHACKMKKQKQKQAGGA